MAVAIDNLPHYGMNGVWLLKLSFPFIPRRQKIVIRRCDINLLLLLAFGTNTEVRFPNAESLYLNLLDIGPIGWKYLDPIEIISIAVATA
jgi:hypothetical protein